MTAVAPSDGERAPAAQPRLSEPATRIAARRSWLEVRWRQFRHAPRPVVRAVLSSLLVAIVLGVAYLAYDLALAADGRVPGGDLRVLFVAGYVAIVLLVGSLVTYLVVPLPRGAAGTTARTPWSAALGFFAAVPIAYLVLVVVSQIVRPLLG
jgi:hypothetical protein